MNKRNISLSLNLLFMICFLCYIPSPSPSLPSPDTAYLGDLSFQIRVESRVMGVRALSTNHWTARELPGFKLVLNDEDRGKPHMLSPVLVWCWEQYNFHCFPKLNIKILPWKSLPYYIEYLPNLWFFFSILAGLLK